MRIAPLRGTMWMPATDVIRSFKHPLGRLIEVGKVCLDVRPRERDQAVLNAPRVEQRDRLSGTVHAQYGILVVTNDLAIGGAAVGSQANLFAGTKCGSQCAESSMCPRSFRKAWLLDR